MKVLIVYYSMYGHIHRMAQAVAEGAKEVAGTEVVFRRVPETLSEEILGKMGALEAHKGMAHIPVCKVEELATADAVIFGTPTRVRKHVRPDEAVPGCYRATLGEGSPCRQGGSVFVSSATQHGGQESTILSFHITLLHQGFVVVGLLTLSRAIEKRRNYGWLALWRFDHCRRTG